MVYHMTVFYTAFVYSNEVAQVHLQRVSQKVSYNTNQSVLWQYRVGDQVLGEPLERSWTRHFFGTADFPELWSNLDAAAAKMCFKTMQELMSAAKVALISI